MKKIILTLTLAFAGLVAMAQPYDWSAGIRGTYNNATIVAKTFVDDNTSLDFGLNFSFNGWGVEASALYEKNFALADNLNFYVGPGVQGGFFPDGNATGIALGLIGVAGMEYAFESVPIALFIDYRPRITLNISSASGIGFGYTDLGMGLKFCF